MTSEMMDVDKYIFFAGNCFYKLTFSNIQRKFQKMPCSVCETAVKQNLLVIKMMKRKKQIKSNACSLEVGSLCPEDKYTERVSNTDNDCF